jgi:hypothetical protein
MATDARSRGVQGHVVRTSIVVAPRTHSRCSGSTHRASGRRSSLGPRWGICGSPTFWSTSVGPRRKKGHGGYRQHFGRTWIPVQTGTDAAPRDFHAGPWDPRMRHPGTSMRHPGTHGPRVPAEKKVTVGAAWRGEYRAQTGIWRLLNFVSVRTIKGRSIERSGLRRTLNATVLKVDNLVGCPAHAKKKTGRGDPRLTSFVRGPVLANSV